MRVLRWTPWCVVLSALVLLFGGTPSHAEEGDWRPLFNGRDLTGWQGLDGPTSNWKVVDGQLHCTGKDGCSWLITTEDFSDFEVSLEFKLPPAGNSGLAIRTPVDARHPTAQGLEIQILDDAADEYGDIEPAHFTGSIYNLAAAQPRVTRPAGQWQTLVVRCVGRSCRVTLNGTVVVDANLADYPDKEKSYPGLLRKSGRLGLQNHQTEATFRNLKVRPISVQP